MATLSYVGKGSVYVQVDNNPLVAVGNVSKLTLNISEEKIEQQDYESAGGGVADSISRIKSVTTDLTTYNFDDVNLGLAVRGTSADLTAGAVADEVVVASKGGLNMLSKLPDLTKEFTVENTTGTTTYVEGTDYIRTRSGFTIPETSSIVQAASLNVSYTSLAGSAIQALVKSATSVRLVFEGLNEARSEKPVIVELYRVQLSPTKSIDLISDKYGELQLTGTVLKDETKVGAGQSKYFQIRQAA